MYYYDYATLNTPYTAGLTTDRSGLVIHQNTDSNYGHQTVFCNASNLIYTRLYSSSAGIGDWNRVALNTEIGSWNALRQFNIPASKEEDTPDFWLDPAKYKNGISLTWIGDGSGRTRGFPSSYGSIATFHMGSYELFQIWRDAPTGNLWFRGANQANMSAGSESGWRERNDLNIGGDINGWRLIYNDYMITAGTTDLTAGSTSLLNGKLYLVYE